MTIRWPQFETPELLADRLAGLGRLVGVPIIESEHLCERITVRRSWRERLFTRPWRPWQRVRVEVKPDPMIYRIVGRGYVGHPLTIARLRQELAAGSKS